MPRGYLKQKPALVGQKKARGGSSRKAEFHRTPAWKRNHYYSPRSQCYILRNPGSRSKSAEPIYDEYWNDDIDERDLDQDIWSEEEEEEEVVSNDDSPSDQDDHSRDCLDSEPQGAPLELLSFSTPEETEMAEKNDGVVEDGDEVDSFSLYEVSTDHSYSMCTDEKSSKAGSSFGLCDDSDGKSQAASFSFVESNRDESDAISSANSSLWDFVECATGISSSSSSDLVDLVPVKSFVEDADASVISKLPEPSVVAEEVLPSTTTSQRCAICLEEKPNTCRIMQRCCHPPACMDCLRTHYMDHQIKDISNFPLRCFWPGCDRIVRDLQIERLAKSWAEMEFYYAQAIRAKQQRKEAKLVALQQVQYKHLQELRVFNLKVHQNCRFCSNTQSVYPGREDETVFRCKQCNTGEEQPIDVISAAEIRALVHLQGDNLVNCPSCDVLICKDGGCDHMTCVCETEFSFESAQHRLRTAPQKQRRVVSFEDPKM